MVSISIWPWEYNQHIQPADNNVSKFLTKYLIANGLLKSSLIKTALKDFPIPSAVVIRINNFQAIFTS